MAQINKGARILGTARTQLRSKLAARYEKGVSIRQLAEETGRSYGFIHRILSESDVTLRRRGGNTRKRQSKQ
jgi:predicted transcriptional regulator